MRIKSTIIFLLVLFYTLNAEAQDTIRLKNGLMLYGLITEVNNKEIRFRVDGGSITMDQVLSYHKNGSAVTVQAGPINQVQSNQTAPVQECERKNTGDL